MPDFPDEIEEVADPVLDDVLDDGEVEVAVSVDEDVPEPCHRAEPLGEALGQNASPDEQSEELAVRPRLPEAPVGDEVRGDVERGLDGDLERVLDEPLLANVGPQRARPGELLELPDVRLDHRELLRDEVGVDHG